MPDQSDATLSPKGPPGGPSPLADQSDATLPPKASPRGVAAQRNTTLPPKGPPRSTSPPGAQLLTRLEGGGGQALLFLGSGAEEGSGFGGEKTSDAGI